MTTWTWPHWLYPEAIWCIVLLPIVVVVWWSAQRARRQTLNSWGNALTLPARRWWGCYLLFQCLIWLIIAVAGPELGSEPLKPTVQARDLLVIIDISQSMLAEDQPPESRLSRAKRYALELLQHWERYPSLTRMGIGIFAGQARLLCPPTEDRQHVAQVIQSLTSQSLGTISRTVQVGNGPIGTHLLSVAGMLKNWLSLESKSRSFTDIIVLSDGDDLNSKLDTNLFVTLAAPIHALAIGDSQRAWPIPLGNQYLMTTNQNGSANRVQTQRHDDVLLQLVQATQGELILEEHDPSPLVSWWRRTCSTKPGRDLTAQTRQVPVNRTGWVLMLALVTLLMECVYGGARRREW